MTSTSTSPTAGGGAAEAVTEELAVVLARLGDLTDTAVTDPTLGDRAADAARIDQIALLERIQAAAAATQAALTVGFARSQVHTQQQQVLVDPRAVGRGIADQLALACRLSPSEGSRRLGVARALYAGPHPELPATAALLRDGRVSAYVAGLVVSETRHLDPERRRTVDQQPAGEAADATEGGEGLAGCAPRKAAMLARKYAYTADPQGYLQRGRTARADRRVTVRPAPDTMTILSGFLPVEQGVACWAALRAHTDRLKNTGDARTRDQIMADTLVERLTGQTTAADVQAEVAIVIPVDALIRPDARDTAGEVAEVAGHGPIPAALAQDILAGSHGRKWWRRLFTAPHGSVVDADPTRRCFDGTIAALIAYRDGGRCREPFCDAPARETDHIVPHRDGGPTTFTNGRATCVRSNRTREMPGWAVRLVHDGTGDQPHTVETTTPTGHTYTSRAGPAP